MKTCLVPGITLPRRKHAQAMLGLRYTTTTRYTVSSDLSRVLVYHVCTTTIYVQRPRHAIVQISRHVLDRHFQGLAMT